MASPVVLVTGGTSGIGLETAKALRDQGCRVYTMSRREKFPEADGNADPKNVGRSSASVIRHLQADVTDEAAVAAAVRTVCGEAGGIDILVNCAGFGISGAVEFTEIEDAKRQFDVNFFGMVIVNKAVIPVMREAGHGRIVNISSVAAPVPIPFQTYYSASKAAINSYTMATANEVRPFGISMCAVQPGDIATGFTDARNKSIAGDDVYGGRISKSVSVMEHDERNGMKASVAGAYIAKITLKKHVKPLYAIGFQYKAVCVLIKLLPARLANRIIGMIYAG